MPLEKSGLNYPNKMAYIYMTSIEEEIGSKAMAAALKLAELPQFIDNYPPDNLARNFDFAYFGALCAAIETMYGPRGERGLGLHAGRACFTRGRDAFGSLSGIGELSLKSIPHQTKLKIGLKGLAQAFSKFSDQHTTVSENENYFIYTIHRCPVCWGRTSNRPICYTAAGIIETGMQWLSQGQSYAVEEVACHAKGDKVCEFYISKEPLTSTAK